MDRNYIELRIYYPDSERDEIDAEALKDSLYDQLVGSLESDEHYNPRFSDITYVIVEPSP